MPDRVRRVLVVGSIVVAAAASVATTAPPRYDEPWTRMASAVLPVEDTAYAPLVHHATFTVDARLFSARSSAPVELRLEASVLLPHTYPPADGESTRGEDSAVIQLDGEVAEDPVPLRYGPNQLLTDMDGASCTDAGGCTFGLTVTVNSEGPLSVQIGFSAIVDGDAPDGGFVPRADEMVTVTIDR